MNKVSFLKFIIPVVVIGASLAGCKSNDSNDDPSPNDQVSCDIVKESLYGSWVTEKATISPAYDYGSGETTDALSPYDECAKDDIDQFLSNGTYNSEDGTNECDPRHSETGKWTFDASNCKVTTTVDGVDEEWNIISVSATTLVARFFWSENGKSYTEEWTFKKF